MHRQRIAKLALLAALVGAGGCTLGRNYTAPDGPRYVGSPAPAAHAAEPAAVALRAPVRPLRVVSFNIEFALRVDTAIAVLTQDPALAGADVVLLQEMDAPSTERVARALGMAYVYYPATFHLKAGQDFGNAVLSRWPIVSDAKLILPHVGRINRTTRIATAATIDVAGERVRVYSTHLGTVGDVTRASRRGQLAAVLDDAARFERVIIGGDFNDFAVSRVAVAAGYAWPTEANPRTSRAGRLDHIVVRGFSVPVGAAGVAISRRRASDHWPVWAVGMLDGPVATRTTAAPAR
jgi:endonuclease/exonuclease/phosphatase family metal-dependent hydrolase